MRLGTVTGHEDIRVIAVEFHAVPCQASGFLWPNTGEESDGVVWDEIRIVPGIEEGGQGDFHLLQAEEFGVRVVHMDLDALGGIGFREPSFDAPVEELS